MASDDLERLRVQLDEDEQMACDAGGRDWMREDYGCIVDAADNRLIAYGEGAPSREQADHIIRHSPARVLRDLDVTRKILDELERARRIIAERESEMRDE